MLNFNQKKKKKGEHFFRSETKDNEMEQDS